MKVDNIIFFLFLFFQNIYYFLDDRLRPVAFIFLVIITSLPILSNIIKLKKLRISRMPLKIYVMSLVILFIQIINGTFTPFVIYLFTIPVFANYFAIKEISIFPAKLIFYSLCFYFTIYYLKNGSMISVLNGLSENYVSSILIYLSSIIVVIERTKKTRLSILPSIFTLFFSSLAFGRMGIGLSLFLAMLIINHRFEIFSLKRRIVLVLLLVFLIPFITLLVKYGETIILSFEILQKFNNRGFESPSRLILLREYLSNMNLANIFLGYKYDTNPWFLHYGLNPHNTLIRIHYYSGIIFFGIIIVGSYLVYQLFRWDRLLFFILIVFLSRGLTDITFFQNPSDFLIYLLLFMPNKNRLIPIKENLS